MDMSVAALSPALYALLDRYTLNTHTTSMQSGERLSREVGQSLEFLDYRPYQQGDELKRVDWRVYARMGRLYTRTYHAERSVSTTLLLDVSPSMTLGGKAQQALQILQLLSTSALSEGSVRVGCLASSRIDRVHTPVELVRVLEQFPRSHQAGPEAPIEALMHYAARSARRRELVIVISDFLDSYPIERPLSLLRARQCDVMLVQVLAEQDVRPPEGTFELADSETGARLKVTDQEVRAYRKEIAAFLANFRRAVLRAGFQSACIVLPSEDIKAALETDVKAVFKQLIQSRILVPA